MLFSPTARISTVNVLANDVCFLLCIASGALLAAEHVKGSVALSVEEGKATKLHVSE